MFRATNKPILRFSIGISHDLLLNTFMSSQTSPLVLLPVYRHLTFICGRGGVHALGAITANYCGDPKKRDFYLECFLEVILLFNCCIAHVY